MDSLVSLVPKHYAFLGEEIEGYPERGPVVIHTLFKREEEI